MWLGGGEVCSRKREKGARSSVRADDEIPEWHLREHRKGQGGHQSKKVKITNRYGVAWHAVSGIHHCVHPWVGLPEMKAIMHLTLRMKACDLMGSLERHQVSWLFSPRKPARNYTVDLTMQMRGKMAPLSSREDTGSQNIFVPSDPVWSLRGEGCT